jgi:eukaryotic-like serine/threonine-protein kinase
LISRAVQRAACDNGTLTPLLPVTAMTERSIFMEALDIADPHERAAYLDQACAGDDALRNRIDELLRAHTQTGNFLEVPATDLLASADGPSVSERAGTVIGPYKLLEQIGEGRFSVVFLAQQRHPVRRKVALKVLKAGMDTRELIARFEAERQALALMDHPHIARVFDAGTTPSGRAYFVMELVRGTPITRFCDENQLPVRERLALFIHVCRAVQHSHQKAVIHRDLKPTNVLVTLDNGVPVPKVIDFGFAMALGVPVTGKTLFTNVAEVVGTPLYMSPEQAEMSGLDVDTRSDVYGLGVLLYELLTGTTPYDAERLKSAGLDALRRAIREEEPQAPSTRISTLGQSAIVITADRRSDPKRLRRLLRRELDWVVMKALEKDRDRRYESANSLAQDLERYLADEPVQACPATAGYRVRKFVRRHKGAVLAGVLALLALVAGIVATIWALIRAINAEDNALN